MTPLVITSIITTDNGGPTYSSNAPVGLVSALTPAGSNESRTSAVPIWGSPYFECTDTVDYLLF
jgi:hypothetical protein